MTLNPLLRVLPLKGAVLTGNLIDLAPGSFPSRPRAAASLLTGTLECRQRDAARPQVPAVPQLNGPFGWYVQLLGR